MRDSKKQIYMLIFGLFPEALLEAIVIPLFPFMVRYLLPNEPETNIGFYTGILGSAFYLPLFVMNLVWGVVSDRYGRKPIILIGMIACFATTLVLSISKSFWLTFLCRFVAGLFGSNSTVAKGMIGDISRDQRARAWGYAMYGSIYGASAMIGPFLGGLLANPRVLYPNWFEKGGLFDSYPYLLVCLIVCTLSIIAFVLTVAYVKENKKYTRIMSADDEDELIICSDSTTTLESLKSKKVDGSRENIIRRRSGSSESLQIEDAIEYKPFVFLSWNTMGPIVLYMAIAYTNMNYATSLPLFFATSASLGGLGLNSRDTALQFGAIAFTKLLFQLVLFEPLLAKIGSPKATYRLAMMLYLPGHLLIPIVGTLEPVFRTLLSILIMLSFGMCEAVGYVSVILMITEAQSPENLGIAHGFASTMAALVRAICPALSGAVWVWGLQLGWPWLVFYTGGVVAVFGCLAAA